jgi:glycosyltransferase involved in cell wall biosynthesis
VIPAYNEGRTIHLILDKIKSVALNSNAQKEIIIVNDCSKDDTEQAVQRYQQNNPDVNIQYFKHEVNQGKGAALHTGIQHASGEYLIIQDADLEYDPDEYPKLLRPILSGEAEVVYGSRFLSPCPPDTFGFWHELGNRLLTWLSNRFTKLPLTDMETCYKMFRKSILDGIELREDRFGFEPEFTAKVSKLGITIHEVPISYRGRTYQAGKKIGWKDGVSAIRCIVKY